MITVVGKIIVPAPGTPVQLSAGFAALGLTRTTVHAAMMQALKSNAGAVYIGTSVMNKGTLVGCAGVLAIPTTNSIPSMGISNTLIPAGVDMDVLYVDADNANEGLLLTVLVT